MTTFESALEAAYEECHGHQQELVQIEGMSDTPSVGWDKSVAMARKRAEYRGACDMLGVLLHLDGQIGLRRFPNAPRPVQPDPFQTSLRFMDWSLGNGYLTQAEYDKILEDNSQIAGVVGRLGEDFYV